MIRPEQIPDEVVEAHISILERMMIGPPTKKSSRKAIAAAINAWPESHWVGDFGLHLPVPSEGGEQKRLGHEFEAAIFSDVDSLYEADKSEGEA
jgi:hypothetical protein